MIDKKATALLFTAMLICHAMGSHGISQPMRKGKGMTLPNQNLRGPTEKHIAVAPPAPAILAKTSSKNKGYNGNSNGNESGEGSENNDDECGCDESGESGGSNRVITVFHDTWQTVGTCTRYFQTLTSTKRTVDTIEVEHTTADTTVNKKLEWQVVSDHKTTQRVLNKRHTHINVLRSRHVHVQVLTQTTATVETITCKRANIQTLTKETVEVGCLESSKGWKRVVKSRSVQAKTLASKVVSIQRVKKVKESVSQTIHEISQCATTYDGKSIGCSVRKNTLKGGSCTHSHPYGVCSFEKSGSCDE